MFSLGDFFYIAQYYLPWSMSFFHAVDIIISIFTVAPFIRLHRLQNQYARRPTSNTSWFNSADYVIRKAVLDSYRYSSNAMRQALGLGSEEEGQFMHDLNGILDTVLDPDTDEEDVADVSGFEKIVLCTERQTCHFCQGDNNQPIVLTRHGDSKITEVFVITQSNVMVRGSLVVARCPRCKADYWPDSITRPTPNGARRTKFFLYEAQYLHISKPAKLWVHRSLAVAQAQAIHQHTTILGFSRWYNASYGLQTKHTPKLSHRQSHRLFVEHMVRLIGSSRPDIPNFQTRIHPTTKDIVQAACHAFMQGGVIPGALDHVCEECTHPKRYRRANAERQPQGGHDEHPAAEIADEAVRLIDWIQ